MNYREIPLLQILRPRSRLGYSGQELVSFPLQKPFTKYLTVMCSTKSKKNCYSLMECSSSVSKYFANAVINVSEGWKDRQLYHKICLFLF